MFKLLRYIVLPADLRSKRQRLAWDLTRNLTRTTSNI